MFGWLKPKSPVELFPLHFKDATSAIDYASRFMVCKILPGVELPAEILDASAKFGAGRAVAVNPDGLQMAAIRVCSDDGGFVALAQTSGRFGPRLGAGDLVTWRPFEHLPETIPEGRDPRMGWVGLITGVLHPSLERTGWRGRERFHD